MAYTGSYGYGDSSRYGGNSYGYDTERRSGYTGGVQEYDRHRGQAFGGVGEYNYYGNRGLDRGFNQGYGVPSVPSYNNRDYEYNREYTNTSYGAPRHVRYETSDYTTSRPYGGGVVYGPQNYRESSKYRGYGGSRSRRYNRDTAYTKYRDNRDTSTSSSSSDDGEGWTERLGNKIKGVFGYGPEADRSNYGNYNNKNYDNDYYRSSRKANKYNTGSYGYNTSNYNTGSYGGSYGGYNNDVVSLRGRRELAPQLQEESGQRQLIWQINTQGFDTDNIKVSDAGSNKVEISGQAEDVGQHHRRSKQFTRIITLPEGANAKEVKSRINSRGLLTITVPYTGKGNLNTIGTRELQVGTGSNRLTGSANKTDYNTTGNTGSQYQQHTTTSSTRTSTNA